MQDQEVFLAKTYREYVRALPRLGGEGAIQQRPVETTLCPGTIYPT